MAVKRCKHGMIVDQCGVCKRWEEHCWSKKEDPDSDQYPLEKKKTAQA